MYIHAEICPALVAPNAQSSAWDGARAFYVVAFAFGLALTRSRMTFAANCLQVDVFVYKSSVITTFHTVIYASDKKCVKTLET